MAMIIVQTAMVKHVEKRKYSVENVLGVALERKSLARVSNQSIQKSGRKTVELVVTSEVKMFKGNFSNLLQRKTIQRLAKISWLIPLGQKLYQKDSSTDVYLRIFWNFSEQFIVDLLFNFGSLLSNCP